MIGSVAMRCLDRSMRHLLWLNVTDPDSVGSGRKDPSPIERRQGSADAFPAPIASRDADWTRILETLYFQY
jgi:hypothetical protein